MELPIEIQMLIAAGVAFLVTQGLKSISEFIGFDISGIGSMITAALVSAVIVFANALLGAVPPEAQQTVQAIFGLLVALLGAFGIHKTVKRPAAG